MFDFSSLLNPQMPFVGCVAEDCITLQKPFRQPEPARQHRGKSQSGNTSGNESDDYFESCEPSSRASAPIIEFDEPALKRSRAESTPVTKSSSTRKRQRQTNLNEGVTSDPTNTSDSSSALALMMSAAAASGFPIFAALAAANGQTASTSDASMQSFQLPANSDGYDLNATSSSAYSDSGSPQKRARTRISDAQLHVLRQYFDINNSPSEDQIKEMNKKAQLPEKVIKHWFRNTLFKVRRFILNFGGFEIFAQIQIWVKGPFEFFALKTSADSIRISFLKLYFFRKDNATKIHLTTSAYLRR